MIEGKSQILLVSDDDAVIVPARDVLQRIGLRVDVVRDEDAALTLLKRQPVDLILCERVMIGMDTLLFRQRLLLEPETRLLPFIYIVPEGLVSTTPQPSEGGMDTTIAKPLDVLMLVARTAALLERAALYEHVVREDPLTHLLNRQAIREEFERELDRARRYQSMASLLFLDLDNFKRVNDEFGHTMGDRVLIHMARVIRRNIRNMDLAGRFGGEEFILCLPETDAAGALMLGNRLLDVTRRACASLPETLHLSFSAGVVEAPRDGEHFQMLVERADQTMYLAKSRGKSQVLCWCDHFHAPNVNAPA